MTADQTMRAQFYGGARQFNAGTALADASLDPVARPETVAPEGYATLLRRLVDGGWAPR